jgi:hypothetical protein
LNLRWEICRVAKVGAVVVKAVVVRAQKRVVVVKVKRVVAREVVVK